MNGDISYNSNNLQTFSPTTKLGIITNSIEHTDIPNKSTELYIKADANGSVIPVINYSSKKVAIAGTIKGSSQADLDARIDTFKGYFNGKDKNLDIAYVASQRRYIATVNALSISRQQKALSATFAVEFICTEPFGQDTSATIIVNQTGYTSAIYTASFTVLGSAPYQLPVITITVNSLTGAGDYINISNDNNGQQILLYGQGITASDVIVIDSAQREVTINDTRVDYEGTFLEVEPGAAALTYSDGFTTRNVDILVEYTKRYL